VAIVEEIMTAAWASTAAKAQKYQQIEYRKKRRSIVRHQKKKKKKKKGQQK